MATSGLIYDRFWSKVLEADADACWEWQNATVNGYGHFRFRGKMWKAHRVAYTLSKGEIPPGKRVLHRCDNHPCCNPAHLFTGTHQDNMDDMVAKGRACSGDRHINHQEPERLRGPRNGRWGNPHGTIRGETHHRAKLTAAHVTVLRALPEGERRRSTYDRLAAEWGVSWHGIDRAVRGETWSHLPLGAPVERTRSGRRKMAEVARARGAGHGRSHLTDADVQTIRAAYAEKTMARGAFYSTQAGARGVSPRTIQKICLRLTWTHLP